MKTSTILTNQKEMTINKQLQISFKNTSGLANALTKDRVQIQNDLQKISAGKLKISNNFQARSS